MTSLRPERGECIESMYYLLFSLGALTFALATFSTLPFLDQQRALPLFHLQLRMSAVCMTLAEVLELVVSPVPKWRPLLCIIAIMGHFLYIYSTFSYQLFNKGELFLMAAFGVSVSSELKILSVILKDGRVFSTLLKLERNRLIRLGSMTLGTVLFLAGTIILLLQNAEEMSMAAGVVNSIGGIIYSVSIYMVFRKDDPIGYEIFDQTREIPTIL